MNSQQMSKIIMKEEVESDESSMDSFEEFPAGAQRYCRMALRARQAAREMGLQVDRDGIHVQSGVDVPEDWTMFLAPPAMVFPKLEAEAPSDDRSTALPEAQDTQEIFEKSVLPTIRQFMSDTNSVGSTLTTTWSKDGNRSEIKIVVERSPMKEAVRMEESQGSEVFTSPRRRLRVVIESDEEEEEQKEEEARTPKKKAKKAKEDPRTPSTRLRSMNLRESSSEPEETQETQDEDIGDSQADPDYVPDTQEERGSYWDNRIPKDAPKDPLDLDY